MACTLAGEAEKHARVYGDGRILRDLHITRARLACEEGQHLEALRCLKNLGAADLEQTAEAALLLAEAYRARQQPVNAEEVLGEALQALRNATGGAAKPTGAKRGSDQSRPAGSAAGDGASSLSSAKHVLAECMLSTAQLHSEMSRLDAALVASKEWMQSLNAAFDRHLTIGQKLKVAGFHRRQVSDCLEFLVVAAPLLEAKELDLLRDPKNSGDLTFALLQAYADRLVDAINECRHSREALLTMAVPVEGSSLETVLPAEALAVRFDVWEARMLALRRTYRACAKFDGKMQLQRAKMQQKTSTEALLRHNGGGGFFGGGVAGATRTDGVVSTATSVYDDDDEVERWIKQVDEQITEDEKINNVAREMSEVEDSVAKVSNAASVLQLMANQDDGSEVVLPGCYAEALAELGRLQLELSARQATLVKGAAAAQNKKLDAPVAAANEKWDESASGSAAGNPSDSQVLQVAERYSNVLNGKDPTQLFKPTVLEGGDDDTPDAAGDAEDEASVRISSSNIASQELDEAHVDFEDIARATLCEAVKAAVATRNFAAARRALKGLALEAYGVRCPQASFEFLCWLQSVNVCIRAEEIFQELLPEDHDERVQLHQLRRLETRWPFPAELEAYQAMKERLSTDSPLFQRLQLDKLPSIDELMLSHLPPLTLVVTFQFDGSHVYVAAACSPGEAGDRDTRLSQLRHLVARKDVVSAEVSALIHRLHEFSARIEKELITYPEVNADLSEKFALALSELESSLIEPLSRRLEAHFWPNGIHANSDSNPRHLMLLPDSLLWGVPLETMPCLLRLFGKRSYGSMSRDLSLHLAAQRVRAFTEVSADGAPLKAVLPAARPSGTTLLTDVFSDDVLREAEKPAAGQKKAETLCMLHQRLVDAKVIGNAGQSCHGGTLAASPEDIKGMLADATAFYSLGYGRFFTTMSARHLASLNLRNLALLGLFHRVVNDGAFRRQTKTDSMKTIRQLAMENAYSTPLIAAFRGVLCSVLAVAPLPTAIAMRSFETFTKAMQAGKTANKAMEEVLVQRTESPGLRYNRLLEGGAQPGPAETPPVPEDLLPLHTRSAYMVVGMPWVCAEEPAPEKKKK